MIDALIKVLSGDEKRRISTVSARAVDGHPVGAKQTDEWTDGHNFLWKHVITIREPMTFWVLFIECSSTDGRPDSPSHRDARNYP